MRIAAAAALLALAGPCLAQSRDDAPPVITVRPSGFEDPAAEARARQERLVRRLERSEFVLRHICTHCMGKPPPPILDAPARPAAALDAPPPALDEGKP